METQTEETFWTIRGNSPGEEPLTLCERHALEASNEAFDLMQMYPCRDMSEVANLMAMICAISGCTDHGEQDFITPTTDHGPCPECEAEKGKRENA